MRSSAIRAAGRRLALVWAAVVVSAGAAVAGAPPQLPPDVPRLDRPLPSDPEKFTFAVVGDKTGGGQENWPVFDRAVDEINRLRPDFAIMIGDMIQGLKGDAPVIRREWEEFGEHASRLAVPLLYTVGNHDVWDAASYRHWRATFGRTYYGFDYKGCRFLVLNTEEGAGQGNPKAGLTPAQVAWAQQEVRRAANAKHLFVFMHQPAFLMGGAPRADWDAIEKELPAACTVFAGHLHNLTRHERRGRRYFVVGPTGGQLGPHPDKALGAFHHYTLVTVEGAEARVAFIEPGSVHPEDVATAEAKAERRAR